MSELFRERVTKYLNEYLEIPEWQIDLNGVAFHNTIKECLRILVERVLTAEEITKELLSFDVILPPNQILQRIAEPKGG